MKFYILSDTHYITPSIMEDGGETLLKRGERLDIVLKPILTKKALEQVASDTETDTVLITGDLTNWGDKPSHEEFRELLRGLRAQGKRVLVTVATHDFHHGHPYVKAIKNNEIAYTATPWDSTDFDVERCRVRYRDFVTDEYKHLSEEECRPELYEAMTVDELPDFYREFGIDESISYHKASGSYCAQLDEKTRVIMLNDNYRDIEAGYDTSATYSTSCFRWIRAMLDEAKRDGMFIFACTHHPLVPPVPAYRIGASPKNMRNSSIGHTLADMGLRLVFSGHTHFCNTTFLRSPAGNTIYDITTPSTQSFPPQFRKTEINPDTGEVKSHTVDVGEIDESIRGNKSTREFIKEDFFRSYREKLAHMGGIKGKISRETTCGNLFFLVKRAAHLSKVEADKIKDIKVYELGFELVENMLAGDGKFTPDTPEYKFVMGLSAVADSVIDAQPFKDIRSDVFKGYSVSQTAQPLLFNNFFSDSDVEIRVFDRVKSRYEQPEFSSSAGVIFMSAISILSLLLSPLELIAVITAIPVLSSKKITKLKQLGKQPDDIYQYIIK